MNNLIFEINYVVKQNFENYLKDVSNISYGWQACFFKNSLLNKRVTELCCWKR